MGMQKGYKQPPINLTHRQPEHKENKRPESQQYIIQNYNAKIIKTRKPLNVPITQNCGPTTIRLLPTIHEKPAN